MGLQRVLPPCPPYEPSIRFLFVSAEFCRLLPSDSASRGTPLLLANTSHCRVCSGLSPPSYCPCRAHNRVGPRPLLGRGTSHTAECADHADRGSVVKRPGVSYSIPLMLHGPALPSASVLFSGKYPFLRRQLLLRIIGCFKYGLSPPSTPSLSGFHRRHRYYGSS